MQMVTISEERSGFGCFRKVYAGIQDADSVRIDTGFLCKVCGIDTVRNDHVSAPDCRHEDILIDTVFNDQVQSVDKSNTRNSFQPACQQGDRCSDSTARDADRVVTAGNCMDAFQHGCDEKGRQGGYRALIYLIILADMLLAAPWADKVAIKAVVELLVNIEHQPLHATYQWREVPGDNKQVFHPFWQERYLAGDGSWSGFMALQGNRMLMSWLVGSDPASGYYLRLCVYRLL